jgi:Ca2+:H+ antiporter
VTRAPRPSLDWLLLLVPVSLVADLLLRQPILTFLSAAGAIVALAGIIGRATEQLAIHSSARLGGLLNATFGNLTELIIAIVLLLAGQVEVVKASLIGSVLGNQLLVLGLAFLAGGIRFKEQHFSARSGGVHSTSMMLAVAGLVMPALFVLTSGGAGYRERAVISVVVAAVLIALYLAALMFVQLTHEHLFETPAVGEVARWTLRRAVLVLVVAALAVGLESELLVQSLEPTTHALGLSNLFIGLIVVPVVGNAAEHGSAVVFAIRDKVNLSLEVAIGSSTQIALFVAPLLVFISFLIGHPMDFVFNTFQVSAVALSTVIVGVILLDGRSNWLEGAQLIGAYLMVAISFFYLGK